MSPKETASRTKGGGHGLRDRLTPARVAALVLGVLAIVFIVENRDRVEIRVLVPVVTMPLYLALLAMFLIGGLCGYVFRRRDRKSRHPG